MTEDNPFPKDSVLYQLAVYDLLYGTFLRGDYKFDKDHYTERGSSAKRRKELITFFKESIQLFLKKGKISELSRQVLSNANQKLMLENNIQEFITYISEWMSKIESRQTLTPDEELIKDTFSINMLLKDLDIDNLSKSILHNQSL